VKRGIIKALPKGLRDWAESIERALSQVQAWVEHPFHVVKNLFRHKKLRYRGLAKNTAQATHLVRPGQSGDRDDAPARSNPDLMTAGLCLDPGTAQGNPAEPLKCRTEIAPAAPPAAKISLRRSNHSARQPRSVFP
jgi:hypothetical protein